jgi:hypothetical protein
LSDALPERQAGVGPAGELPVFIFSCAAILPQEIFETFVPSEVIASLATLFLTAYTVVAAFPLRQQISDPTN